jgi:hypothetical protein
MDLNNTVYHFSKQGEVIAKATLEEAVVLWKSGRLKTADAYWREGMEEWEPIIRVIPLLEKLYRDSELKKQELLKALQERHKIELGKSDPAYGPWRCIKCEAKFNMHADIPNGFWPVVWAAMLIFGSFAFLIVASFFISSVSGISLALLGFRHNEINDPEALAGYTLFLTFVAFIIIAFVYTLLICLSFAHLINAGILFAEHRRHKGRCCPNCLSSDLIKETGASNLSNLSS